MTSGATRSHHAAAPTDTHSMNPRYRHLLLTVLAASSLAITGCGGGESESAEAEPAAPAEQTETAATEEAPAEESTTEESTTDSFVLQPMDVEATLSASDKAAQSRDWTAATDNLLKLQMSGSLKNDAESWQYNRRMTVLQDQLLQAAENGDPKAKAAIDLLRRSRRVH